MTLAMMSALKGARLIAGSYEPSSSFPEFGDYRVETTWINRVKVFRSDPRRALPFLAPTYSNYRVEDVDLVICSSAGWSHGISTDAPKIVYCHNPPRWLHQRDDYFAGASSTFRRVSKLATTGLTSWDRRRAHTATAYLANSTVVRDRIRAAYGIDAEVLPPPAGITPFGPCEAIPGIEPGFLLNIARARGYKNSAAVAEAVSSMPTERLVVVGTLPDGVDRSAIGDRLVELETVSDAQLRWLYSSASALVAVAHDDFGLTPVEAFGFGLPVLALRAGGYLDTCVDGLTGYWIEEVTVGDIAKAVDRLRSNTFSVSAIVAHAQRWTPARFEDDLRSVVGRFLPVPVRIAAPATVGTSTRFTARVNNVQQAQGASRAWS
ncbi:MAG: glycosyltransferase family 4 protein [Pseudonocardiales bacterium]|nr:glycosyltransferase family 4 protein [Pseudonocardiales bacterium]